MLCHPIRERDDGTYDVVEDDLDWEEFFTVSQNEYDGSIEQITGRAQAQEAVQWVRDMMDKPTSAPGRSAQAAD